MILTLLMACTELPFVIPCRPDPDSRVDLALDEPTALGNTGDDLLAAARVGVVRVDWSRRRFEVVPAHDSLRLELEPAGGVTESLMLPDEPENADYCRAISRVSLPVIGRVWAADGTASADVDGELAGDADGHFELQVGGPAELSDDRLDVVDARLDDHLDPPDSIGLYLHYGDGPHEVQTAQIVAEGPSYGVSVWLCDSQRDPTCLTW